MTAGSTLPQRIVTVSSCDYLPGTRVMLSSFLNHNRWFGGTITVIADDLAGEDAAALRREFPQLEVASPGRPLVQAITKLVAALPHLGGRARRFYSLDAFASHSDGPVLFCDSDLLFTGDIAEFCAATAPLVACGDRTQLTGIARDPTTLAEGGSVATADFSSFNAGLMLIGETSCGSEVHARLLALLDHDAFAAIASDHTDQAVLNRYFGTEVVLADARFNRLIGHAGRLRGAASVSIDDAAVLHFNGPAKPWDFARHPLPGQADPALIKAYELWFAAYGAFLSQQHFRANIAR